MDVLLGPSVSDDDLIAGPGCPIHGNHQAARVPPGEPLGGEHVVCSALFGGAGLDPLELRSRGCNFLCRGGCYGNLDAFGGSDREGGRGSGT